MQVGEILFSLLNPTLPVGCWLALLLLLLLCHGGIHSSPLSLDVANG